jgi:ubiquinone/menaquinone biosynthesis C-methylase UbiE
MQPIDGYPMLENLEDIRQLLADKCMDTISFQKGEVIADIGAGNGYIEAMLSIFHDSLTFYIQDIDSSVCNQAAIDLVSSFYQELRGTPNTCRLIAVNGTDKASCLPDSGFDRILMLWTYQYLKYPREIIIDLREKLKTDGLLYVINPEMDYEYGNELRSKYGWNGSTVEKQISDILDCGFILVRFARNYNDNQLPYIMIFKKKYGYGSIEINR